MNDLVEVSQMDKDHLKVIRQNVSALMVRAGRDFINPKGGKVLDVAPQIHEGIAPYVSGNVKVETLDIDPKSGATYIGDLCNLKSIIASESFNFVVCTEVIEHTLQPFHAIDEIHRILKTGGLLFLTVPYNFRIHGPLPDCWRFTEHGLRALLKDFKILELNPVETPDRALMPIHYAVIAERV
jgi:ubiquinone/menaquinone biosynthesis C-methylase UbiE